MTPLTALTLSRFSCCSFLLPGRSLSKSCHSFKVLPLKGVFPFTTNSNFCLPLFLENFAVNPGLASDPLVCLPVPCILVLGSSWVCGMLEGNAILHLLLMFSLSSSLLILLLSTTCSNCSYNNNFPTSIILLSCFIFIARFLKRIFHTLWLHLVIFYFLLTQCLTYLCIINA